MGIFNIFTSSFAAWDPCETLERRSASSSIECFDLTECSSRDHRISFGSSPALCCRIRIDRDSISTRDSTEHSAVRRCLPEACWIDSRSQRMFGRSALDADHRVYLDHFGDLFGEDVEELNVFGDVLLGSISGGVSS